MLEQNGCAEREDAFTTRASADRKPQLFTIIGDKVNMLFQDL